MPSTTKLCIWVPRRWLAELERLGRAHGTTPAGYVRLLVESAVLEEAPSPSEQEESLPPRVGR